MVDFQASNLHVLNYSVPIHTRLSLAELRPHLFTLPDQPDWIPYRTSYYKETWGFCLAHRQLATLPEGRIRGLIDSTLAEGSLTYGECFLPGSDEREVLLSTHVCHPSLANDNLSGIAVMTWLARELAAREQRRYSYRFLFIPGTIGSIAWLARNEERAGRIAPRLGGGQPGRPWAVQLQAEPAGARGDRPGRDRRAAGLGRAVRVEEFVPFGYDERQYCSPGFDLPVGSLTRTPWGVIPSTTPRRTTSPSSSPPRSPARCALI